MSDLRDLAPGRSRPTIGPARLAGLALALALAILVAVLALRPEPSPGIMLMGGEDLRLAGRSVSGEQLWKPGSQIETGARGQALLRLDGGTLALAAGSRARLMIVEADRRVIHLALGSVTADLGSRAASDLVIRTPAVMVEAAGAAFAIDHDAEGSVIVVRRGQVRVEHAGGSGWLVAGQRWPSAP